MKKKILFSTLVVCLFGLISACSYTKQFYNSSSDYGSKEANKQAEHLAERPQVRPLSEGSSSHQNAKLFISNRTTGRVSQIQGVAAAVVVLSEKSAYVGITTDSTSTGTASKVRMRDNSGQRAVMEKLSPKLIETIKHEVQSMHPQIEQVYTSSNPTYVSYLNQVALEHWKGRSLTNNLDAFNTRIRELLELP